MINPKSQEADMGTPLYEALAGLAGAEPLRLHMPGHKGRLPGDFAAISALDFTEIAPTGDLYTTDGPIAMAERRWAAAVGAREALFFTCGATQGIHTMLAAAVGLGGTLILDRGCHKSVYHGMALLDITPVYLQPALLPETALPGPVTAELLEPILIQHPEAQAVFLTSPSYYGVITDLAPIADLCHRYGKYLLVDQAHGAHFPFLGLPSGVSQGADLTVVSAHKTLPALGSSAILYAGDRAPWSAQELKRLSGIFATTSPSYPILTSMDCALTLLQGEYGECYREMAKKVEHFRAEIGSKTPFRCLMPNESLSLDPCRLTIDTRPLSGKEADRLLQNANIYVEMSDQQYLVCILTCCDTQEDLDRLLEALKTLPVENSAAEPILTPPPEPIFCQSIRSALFGPREFLPLFAAKGRISAQILAPYPPGIPVVAPGEEITEKHIAYLQKKSYNIEEEIAVTRHPQYKGGTP
jgi:lysine decarboxylase